MLLESQQEDLLTMFVEGHRSVPTEERWPFLAFRMNGGPDGFQHVSGRASFHGSISDAEVLADAGLLRRSFGPRNAQLFAVSQTFASWNRIVSWLRQLDGLRRAA